MRGSSRSGVMALTRRELLLAAAAAGTMRGTRLPWIPTVAMEGYIWQNWAQRQKKTLAAVLDEAIPMARTAGYRNIEVNQGFFVPEVREKMLALTRENKLQMPSVYVGGGMHQMAMADKTIALALEIGGLCKEFGCGAIVNNPDTKPDDAEKTDAELAMQAASLNRMGRVLLEQGFQFRVHHHTAEMKSNAREWRHILRHTDARYVKLCLDVEHAQHGGMDPNVLLREAVWRVTEIHLRNKKNGIPLETFDDGDIDYHETAAIVKQLRIRPLVVVELAYHDDTVVTRPLEEDLKISRVNAEKLFFRH